MKKPDLIVSAVKLRQQAEAQLQDSLTPADPFPTTAMEAQRLIHELRVHPDQAMYTAKRTGGNRYRWFNTDSDRQRKMIKHQATAEQIPF